MHEALRLRGLADRAKRLAATVSDPTSIANLTAYEQECRMDADVREADLDNAVWNDARVIAG